MPDATADLSIYRLKQKVESIEQVIAKPGLAHVPLDLDQTGTADLYIKKPVARSPRWGRFFDGYVDLTEFGKSSSTAAVLLVTTPDDWFAIPFGIGGRSLIRKDEIEGRFGLLTVLNSIPRDRVRSIDKTTLDARTQSHVQALRETSPQEFGLDVERDLVRAVTGTPTEPSLGLRLHGMDGLRATLAIELREVPEKLAEYSARSKMKHYKKHFPWIDHIAPVGDPEKIESLDRKVLEHIHAQDVAKCWMAVPDVIDWGQYTRFRYGGYKRKHLLHHDISLTSWIAELNDASEDGFVAADISLELLKSTTVRCLNADDQVVQRWPAYACLSAEVDYKRHSYVLAGGKWYRVDRDFVQAVDAFYAGIDKFEDRLPEYNDDSETAYNERICVESNDLWALMDRKNIVFSAQTPIEFCDVYTADRDIIHIKRYSQSSVLSHLFSQGTVSGELFRSESGFRRLVNDKLPFTHKLDDPDAGIEQELYRIVYAIVSSEPGAKLPLPFFSRLNLRSSVTRLKAYGYRVALAKVAVNADLQMTKKYAKGQPNR